MFDLFKGRFNFSTAPRVVHRLPGRMRIHFPALERLSSRWQRYSAPVADLVKIKQGIQNTNIQPATGNVLITYDTDTLGEKDILNWLESIVKIFLYNIRNYSSLSEDNLESLLNRVKIQLMALEK
jgi:hypothetical protein